MTAVYAPYFSKCVSPHFAVPHPSRLTAIHLPPGGRFAACRRWQWRGWNTGNHPTPLGVTRFDTGKRIANQTAYWLAMTVKYENLPIDTRTPPVPGCAGTPPLINEGGKGASQKRYRAGGAPRSESKSNMIAGGSHTTVYREVTTPDAPCTHCQRPLAAPP